MEEWNNGKIYPDDRRRRRLIKAPGQNAENVLEWNGESDEDAEGMNDENAEHERWEQYFEGVRAKS